MTAPMPAAFQQMKQAQSQLEEVLELEQSQHLEGARDAYRVQLDEALRNAHAVLASLRTPAIESEGAWLDLTRLLTKGYASRAEAARYGAGQLSRSAQRAPTMRDCFDGWHQVAQIVKDAEAAAVKAQLLAAPLNDHWAAIFAQRAGRSAEAARVIEQERNHAYTFHTLPGFSFGEGWYVAAAGVLGQIEIQVMPDTPQEPQARSFLAAAGLSQRLVPHRSRPANPKHLTALIAEAFALDPVDAQARLRAAFFGQQPCSEEVRAWLKQKGVADRQKKVMLWVRISDHDAHRNTNFQELAQLAELLLQAGLTPIYFGDAIPSEVTLPAGIDLTLCWKEPLFQGLNQRRAQLQLFETLRAEQDLIAQVGVTTAGMDGPALMGLPTFYLTDEPNVRLGQWVGRVPGYREVVRSVGGPRGQLSQLLADLLCSS